MDPEIPGAGIYQGRPRNVSFTSNIVRFYSANIVDECRRYADRCKITNARFWRCDITSSPQIPTSGRGYRGSACDGPHCASASLSDRAGAPHCRLSRRRHERRPCAPDRRVAFQAIRTLVRGREPSGGHRQHRPRSRRSCGAGRLHAKRLRIDRIAQRVYLHGPQVQFHARHDAGREHIPSAAGRCRPSLVLGPLSP